MSDTLHLDALEADCEWNHLRVGQWSLVGGVQAKAEPGARCQDAVGYWTDGERLVAVVADGVSQSFQGDLAARAATKALPCALARMAWAPFPNEDAIRDAFTMAHRELEDLVSTEGDQRLATKSGLLARSLQRTRDEDGSQAVLIVLLARLHDGRGVLVHLGDAWSARRTNEGMKQDEICTRPDIARSRFSSVNGVRGTLHVGHEFALPQTLILASDGADLSWADVLDGGGAARDRWQTYALERASRDDVSFFALTRQAVGHVTDARGGPPVPAAAGGPAETQRETRCQPGTESTREQGRIESGPPETASPDTGGPSRDAAAARAPNPPNPVATRKEQPMRGAVRPVRGSTSQEGQPVRDTPGRASTENTQPNRGEDACPRPEPAPSRETNRERDFRPDPMFQRLRDRTKPKFVALLKVWEVGMVVLAVGPLVVGAFWLGRQTARQGPDVAVCPKSVEAKPAEGTPQPGVQAMKSNTPNARTDSVSSSSRDEGVPTNADKKSVAEEVE